MPSTTKSQQRLFCMAYAVRKGELPRSKVWKQVLDIVDSDMTNQEIKDFTVLKEGMQPLATYLLEAVGDKLGKGAEGTVYDEGNGRVRKVFHRGKVPVGYQLLKAATDMGVIQSLPKVFEIGPNYIIREDCKPGTTKCKKYWKVATTKPFSNDDRQLWQMVQDGEWTYNPDTDKVETKIKMVLSGLTKEVVLWMAHLQYELSQIKPGHGLGDFAEKNFGETQDGRIVLMDF